MARGLSFCCLLLFAFAGSTVAQNDPQYVIKRRTDAGSSEIHYLAHVKVGDNWVLQDATTFNPNCVWYSGNTFDQSGINHNYYFIDEGVYHFLYAPLTTQSPLHLSDSMPSAQLLRNSEQNYYFWDWDWDNSVDGGGLARGIQHLGIPQSDCGNSQATPPNGYSWGGGECWEVYWVEYNDDVSGQWGWRLSSASHYTLNNSEDPVPGAARFRKVTVTPHDIEVVSVSEGLLGDLDDVTLASVGATHDLSMTAGTYSYSYIPAYTTYVFEGGTHNYFNNGDQGTSMPTATTSTGTPSTYTWTVTGPGAEYLSFSSSEHVTTITGSSSSQTLRYYQENQTGHKTATLTLTVTYSDGSTQIRTATVTVKTPCGNPLPIGDPVVVYDYVTVSWVNTADRYMVEWKKESDNSWDPANTAEVINGNTYTFTGLDYSTAYHYRVTAFCDVAYLDPPTNPGKFTTMPEPELLIYGSVFGGGRVADVTGKTEVVVINCDTIGAVYGGNDIAGSVLGLDGSNIILGIDASTASNSYAQIYNGGQASTKVRVNDVYGGGNGYYSYNGSTFEAATADYTTATIASHASVTALSESQQWNDPIWTNTSDNPVLLTLPSIVKTAITVTNDKVKVDSLFGGAKNAFVTHIIGTNPDGSNVYATNGSSITIDGGTIFAAYGGNNIGGSQGNGKHKIDVSHTTTKLEPSIVNTAATGYGRDFGVRYLFGGGNKVAGSTTDITITGGQLDTIFGGGNEADVYAANVTVNCELGAYTSGINYVFGNTYTNAINPTYYTTVGTIGNQTIDTANYLWDGFTGVYNVRTLFGGSNQAAMNGVPTVNLTSGSIGTVYGGGNAGDMLAHLTTDQILSDTLIKYGTHVVMNNPTILIDYLYGGCQVSNVDFSTWVEINNGHVGYVYGGCNVSGDVGSTRINTALEPINLDDPNVTPQQKRAYFLEYQQVQGATYVVASGGVIYKNLFAGSNGYYHCNDNVSYISGGVNYGDPEGKYIGLTIPTHNVTNAIVHTGANIKGNVYAGGNLACVGFTTQTVGNSTVGYKPFPSMMVGLASVQMDGGTVNGDVYGGGNMASIFGSNEVQVSGGTIGGALYGGNDKLGMVAQPTNRALPNKYFLASDGNTPLTDVKTYVSVTGRPEINTVYGGGNGAYDNYTSEFYCDPENLPIQRDIFVDINIDGYPDEDGHQGGHIQTVYGGGNGVTVLGKTTVFLNVKGENDGEPIAYDHVNTIFGGNNLGHLNILADIILLKGQVNTVYGGCNKGAMAGDNTVTVNGTVYEHVGSLVRLRDEYTVTNTIPTTPVTTTTMTTAKVSGAVYGGCRMNGVNNNSLVLVEGGNHNTASIYGGNDISGDVGLTSRVVITNSTNNNNGPVIANAFGGGNGNYDYTSALYSGLSAPYSVNSRVDMLGGTAGNIYAGGYAGECGHAVMQVEGGTVTGRVFGGGNMAGVVTSHPLTTTIIDDELGHAHTVTNNNPPATDGTSTVTVTGGQVNGGIFGGNNLEGSIAGPVNVYIYGGTLGTNTASMTDGIFGGGFGKDTQTDGNVTVTIDKPSGEGTIAPTIYANIYGGSALGQVNTNTNNLTLVDFKDGNLHGNLFGGGMGQATEPGVYEGGELITPEVPGISALVKGVVNVSVSNGTIFGDIYGGCNLNGTVNGDVTVGLTGGTVGSEALFTAGTVSNVFGGGFGHETTTLGNVTVNFGTLTNTHDDAPMLYGDVYGGSGYGDVNSPQDNNGNSDDVTIVNILNGTVKRDVYGGGLGDASNPAHVNGKVYVNVGALTGALDSYGFAPSSSLSGKARIDGSVYGCNNVNGTPLDSVFVNIYATHHWDNNAYPTNPPTTVEGLNDLAHTSGYFALSAVYGGGNRAAYLPPLTNASKPRSSTVHVWGCRENTIYDVYGGGNAADVGIENGIATNTRVIIDGGRIYRMFGGGNGFSETGNHNNPSVPNYNPGANIYGTASSYVHAGLINEVYGGANQYGSIDNINLNLTGANTNCADKVFAKVFGCANEAPINHDIVTTVRCNVGEIGELYGGSNLASIGVDNPNRKANVTLNLYGGDYETVFGGSKGRLDDPATDVNEAVEANIYGDVTLNLYGGKVINAFGGSDQNGNIKGIITVNVLDYEQCGLDLTNVYGASNVANYDPWQVDGATVQSPIVNVMHIYNVDGTGEQQVMRGIRGNVYGGGYQADVNAKPVVNIGYDAETVVYGTTTMANLIPLDYPATTSLTDFPMAYITGDVFGGGDFADVTGKTTVNMRQFQSRVSNIFGGGNEAGISSSEVNVYDGIVTTAVYGGCNTKGNVSGDIAVNIYGGTLGTSSTNTIKIFGGGYGGPDPATSNPGTTTDGNVTVTIGGTGYTPNIYGTVYGGSALGGVNSDTEDLTMVELKSGTINGNVFGGGLGNSTIAALVKGNIHVVGNGTDVNGWVFGANDQNGDPEGMVSVTVNNGTITNVVGGGNVADYTTPSGSGGTIVYSPYVHIAGGTVTDMVVGGGNMADIAGNTMVELTGGNIGSENHEANVFGGGYGQGTKVTGHVLVNFGDIDIDNTGETPVENHTIQPMLWGDIYGGSALGDVNTANTSGLKTTVNLFNGTIYGAAYGGGLGRKQGVNGATSNIPAYVYGEVHVNVGRATDANDQETFVGMADLVQCDVYGGNNLNGTPKKGIFVDVYKTYHTTTNYASYIESGASFAIDEVFGGGNQSNYVPTDLNNKTNVYLHLCENTVRRVFGGGNAADVPGINLYLDGGRYDYVFGGGNGEVTPASVGAGGIYLRRGGGRIHQLTNGSNDQGTVTGPIVAETVPICDDNLVEDYFLGNNLMDLNADIETTIYCGEGNNVEMRFVNLYCGSNRAQIYGNINVTIEGGVFDHVFGGSKGVADDPATTENEGFASNIYGNVNLFVTGGTIGELFGGCDVNGNITGKINIEVYENVNSSCPLFIGDIYGAGNHTNYTPSPANLGGAYSPKVKVLKGTIGGTSPSLPVKDENPSTFAGNVFGGGNIGSVTSNPKVIVGDGSANTPVTILGDVFGGGNEGNITGNPLVIVVPETHELTITQTANTSACQVKVLNSLGNPVSSGVLVGEDLDLRIKAIPSVYNGFGFINWTIEAGAGSSVDAPTSTSTIYTMGTENSTLKANFATNLPTHTLTVTQGEHGNFTVKDGFEQALTGQMSQGVLTSDPISEGAELYLKATPAAGYKFDGWIVEGEGASVGSTTSATTTFTMGTGDATITATYSLVRRRR